jgi:hypothetical protein
LRFLVPGKCRSDTRKTLEWSQELTGTGAETASAHWASADAVPKLMKNWAPGSCVEKPNGACRSRLPNFGVAKDPEGVSFQRLPVGEKSALISAEGNS